ncbi:MAG: hypothetical protein GX442_05510 [Candidatus Riflebacteria bacterium]|nr:hypothetical protein [Candidatus Riflebacteria bacterium]
MNRRGWTLVETIVTILVFSLLLLVVFRLLTHSFRQSTALDEHGQITAEAARLLAALRNDLEDCMGTGTGSPAQQIRSAMTADQGGIGFTALENGNLVPVSYRLATESRGVIRSRNGITSTLCRGLVTRFDAACLTLWTVDGTPIIRRLEATTDPALGLASEARLLSAWFEVTMSFEINRRAQGAPPIRQDFPARVFPVRFIRALQSSWYRPPP